MKAFGIIVLMLGLTACNSNLAVMFSPEKQAVDNHSEIFAINRLTATAGEIVKVSGLNLTDGMIVQIGDQVVPLTVNSKSSGYFIMPDSKTKDFTGATFLSKEFQTLATLSLLSDAATTKIPVMDADPNLICGDTTYQDPTGHLHTGLRNCSSSLPICSSEGQAFCVTNASFLSVNVDKLKDAAKNLRSTSSIAGVDGSLANCQADGDVNCVVVGPTFAAGLTVGAAAKLRAGTSLAGVAGAISDCASNGGQNCYATSSYFAATSCLANSSSCFLPAYDGVSNKFKAIDFTAITAGVIKDTSIIGGITGTFAPPCAADGATDCLTTARYKSMDTDSSVVSVWDIRSGKTLGGIAGSIAFYRNLADLSTFNEVTQVGSSNSGTVSDVHDTIDDLNNGGATLTNVPPGFPTVDGSNWVLDPTVDTGAVGGTAGNGLCDGSEVCIYRDRISGLYWNTRSAGNPNWWDALTHCQNLVLGPYTDWRLPTEKELMQAYIDGIWAARSRLGATHDAIWSSTSISEVPANAWTIDLSNGTVAHYSRTDGYYIYCVR